MHAINIVPFSKSIGIYRFFLCIALNSVRKLINLFVRITKNVVDKIKRI